MATDKADKRTFGSIRELPSGRFQARFTGPDGMPHKGPRTWEDRDDAVSWLTTEKKLIENTLPSEWVSPEAREKEARAEEARSALTVEALCDMWLASGYLKESTAASHRRKLDNRVLNTDLADESVVGVDRARILAWWLEIQQEWPDTGNTNAMAYKRLHTAFQYAVDELEVLTVNPVKIKGAGKPPRPETRDRDVITPTEAKALADGMSDRLRAPMQLLLWCGLRLGELLELRRKDIRGLDTPDQAVLRIRRNAQRMEDPESGRQVMVPFDTPKSDAGNRDIGVPAHVAAELREHCDSYVEPDPEALIVTTRTGAQMLDTTWRSRMVPAKRAAEREDVSPHDCRRFYGTMLVTNGVSLEEARRLMGHETVTQLMDYQRAASGYEKSAADVLNKFLGGDAS